MTTHAPQLAEKHYGPGRHPGTGTPQSVHGGGAGRLTLPAKRPQTPDEIAAFAHAFVANDQLISKKIAEAEAMFPGLNFRKGNLLPSAKAVDTLMAVLDEFPEWAYENVTSIVLEGGSGYEFQVGEQAMTTGADWFPPARSLTIYHCAEDWVAGDANRMRDLLAHEIGHAITQTWDEAVADWLNDRSDEYAAEENYAGLTKYLRIPTLEEESADGWRSLEFTRAGLERWHDDPEAQPALAMHLWGSAWRNGEDGVTEYSAAWHKQNVSGETFAEMFKLYMQEPRPALQVESIRAYGRRANAGFLTEAFLMVIQWMEDKHDARYDKKHYGPGAHPGTGTPQDVHGSHAHGSRGYLTPAGERKVAALARKLAQDSIEHAVTFDADGNVLAHVTGDYRSAIIPNDMLTDKRAVVFYHNHPPYPMTSPEIDIQDTVTDVFSDNDILIITKMSAPEAWLTTPWRTVRIRRPAAGWKREELIGRMNKFFEDMYQLPQDRAVRKGSDVSRQQRQWVFSHGALDRIITEMGGEMWVEYHADLLYPRLTRGRWSERDVSRVGMSPKAPRFPIWPKDEDPPKRWPAGPQRRLFPASAIDQSLKHYGPGAHPGTGTPQTVHAGSGSGISAVVGMSRTPRVYIQDEEEDAALGRAVKRAISSLPSSVQDLIKIVLVRPENEARALYGGRVAAEWDARQQALTIYALPGAKERVKSNIGHEAGHAIWSALNKQSDTSADLKQRLAELEGLYRRGGYNCTDYAALWAKMATSRPDVMEQAQNEAFAEIAGLYFSGGYTATMQSLSRAGWMAQTNSYQDRMDYAHAVMRLIDDYTDKADKESLTADSKHYGPGPHPGTGTPQDVHAGNSPETEHIKISGGDDNQRAMLEEALSLIPWPVHILIEEIHIRPLKKTRDPNLGTYTPASKRIDLWQAAFASQDVLNDVVLHEVAHGLYTFTVDYRTEMGQRLTAAWEAGGWNLTRYSTSVRDSGLRWMPDTLTRNEGVEEAFAEGAALIWRRGLDGAKKWVADNPVSSRRLPHSASKASRAKFLDAIYEVLKDGRMTAVKHYGPGRHPGTGTPQSVHGDGASGLPKPTIFDKAVAYFGITGDLREAGYILPDGRLLDLSGKNQGGSRGMRSLDHREVNFAYEDEPDSNIMPMLRFMAAGAIRISYFARDALYIDVISGVKLTQQQRDVLQRTTHLPFAVLDITLPDEYGTIAGKWEFEPWGRQSLQEALEIIDIRVSKSGTKHYGPGPHPGTGTPQSVHAGAGATAGLIVLAGSLGVFDGPGVDERLAEVVRQRGLRTDQYGENPRRTVLLDDAVACQTVAEVLNALPQLWPDGTNVDIYDNELYGPGGMNGFGSSGSWLPAGTGRGEMGAGTVVLRIITADVPARIAWTVAHEFGHTWSLPKHGRTGRVTGDPEWLKLLGGWQSGDLTDGKPLSEARAAALRQRLQRNALRKVARGPEKWLRPPGKDLLTNYSVAHPEEAFAEAVAAYVVAPKALKAWRGGRLYEKLRTAVFEGREYAGYTDEFIEVIEFA